MYALSRGCSKCSKAGCSSKEVRKCSVHIPEPGAKNSPVNTGKDSTWAPLCCAKTISGPISKQRSLPVPASNSFSSPSIHPSRLPGLTTEVSHNRHGQRQSPEVETDCAESPRSQREDSSCLAQLARLQTPTAGSPPNSRATSPGIRRQDRRGSKLLSQVFMPRLRRLPADALPDDYPRSSKAWGSRTGE